MICDSGSCRELVDKIFVPYLPFGVLIISPTLSINTPSGLGDPLIERLGLFRWLFSGLSRDPEVRDG
jgi:hypothetical protein